MTFCSGLSHNTLPNNQFLDYSKLKALADDKINTTQKLKFDLDRVDNIVGKGENAGHQYFLPFSECFQKATYTGSLNVLTMR